MGLEIDEADGGDNCGACFPAGETPLYMMASITGMVTGDLWLPGQPPPPNGVYKMVQIVLDNCVWRWPIGIFRSTLWYNVIGTTFVLELVPPTMAAFFFQDVGRNCLTKFGNQITGEGTLYGGGSCVISWV